MKCKISEFNLNINNKYNRFFENCDEYFINLNDFDLTIFITEDELNFEQLKYSNKLFEYDELEYVCIYRKLAEWLPLHNAFVLHSATFDVDGVGVAFAAHSGTGKTTHMLLWQKLLGERMTIVNGDKPIVRFFDDEPQTPYAYGTPWNGKERLGCNMRTPVKHICFIERSETNYVEKMQPAEIVNLIFNQVYMPKDPAAVANTMQLINRFINSCQLWKIHCNMDIQAAEVAYKAIFGD